MRLTRRPPMRSDLRADADWLVLTEQTLLPALREDGADKMADELQEATTAYVNDPDNEAAVALAREIGFRWTEGGN